MNAPPQEAAEAGSRRRAAFDLLAHVLRGGHVASSEVASCEALALELAAAHHVAPMFAALLQASGAAVGPVFSGQLQQVEREARIEAFWWVSELKGILAALVAAHLDVLPLKGPWFAERYYGGTAFRTCRDLDLLVRKQDFARAEAVLEHAGFEAAGRGDDYHRTFTRGTTAVELHFDVENPLAFDFDIDGAWRRSSTAEVFGQPVCELEACDEFVFLCLHAARHRFERLSHVLDLARMLDRNPGLAGAVRNLRGELDGLRGVVALGCLMAARLASSGVPRDALPVDAHSLVALESIADGLWAELALETRPSLDWSEQHRFFLTLETRPMARAARRLRHLRILARRLIEEDFAFAGRLGARRRWQVLLLRPLRIALRKIRSGKPGAPPRRD